MTTQLMPSRTATPLAIKLVGAVGMVALLVAGIFVLGRLAADDRDAMLYTAVFFAAVLVTGFLLTRGRTDLRVPLGAGYAVVAAAATIVLGLPMLGDDEVNEQVVTAAPAGAAGASSGSAATGDATPRGGDSGSGAAAKPAPAGNVQLARGAFQAISHPGSGTAAVIELAGGDRKLTLTDFETDNGPDLRVYLASGDPAGGGDLGDFEDLGSLKGNKGNQQYDVPKSVDLDRFSNVVVWCRAFSVGFTSAPLAKS